ncbi:Uncharacterised protein [Candidatus Gugararchaeum adminiculabundum]|nr:Uncharacterised protein [Candidatus Gugararchaeum adminiculabundum]
MYNYSFIFPLFLSGKQSVGEITLSGHNEHQKLDDSEFLQSIDSLRKSEQESKDVISQAEKDAELKRKRASERAAELIDKAKIEARDLKDDLLREARDRMKKDEDKILNSAEKDADSVRSTKIPARLPSTIAEKLLE